MGRRSGSRDRQREAGDKRTRLWLCLNSTACANSTIAGFAQEQKVSFFIPMRLKSDGFSVTLSLSQMARHQTSAAIVHSTLNSLRTIKTRLPVDVSAHF